MLPLSYDLKHAATKDKQQWQNILYNRGMHFLKHNRKKLFALKNLQNSLTIFFTFSLSNFFNKKRMLFKMKWIHFLYHIFLYNNALPSFFKWYFITTTNRQPLFGFPSSSLTSSQSTMLLLSSTIPPHLLPLLLYHVSYSSVICRGFNECHTKIMSTC